MIRWGTLKIKDDPLFPSAEFKFEPGLHVIYGLNKTNVRSRNGNGAGKSYLMSRIPELKYGMPWTSNRQDKSQKGSIELDFHIGRSSFLFSRNGKNLKVSKDGSPVVDRNVSKWVESKWPITEQLFKSTVYVDSRIPHPLVMGSSTERRNFLSKFFKLDRLDVERKIVKAELDSLKAYKIQKTEVERELAEVEAELKDLGNRKGLKTELQELETRLRKLQKKAQASSFQLRALDYTKSVVPQLELICNRAGAVLDAPSFKAAHAELITVLEDTKENLEHAKRWAQHLELQKEYEQSLQELPKSVVKLWKAEGYEQIKQKARDYRKLPRLDKPVAPEAPEVVDEPKLTKKLKASLAGHQIVLKNNTSSISKALRKLDIQIDKLEHEEQHVRKFKSGKCPTCGSSVKARDAKAIADDLKGLQKLHKELEALNEAYEEHTMYLADLESYEQAMTSYRKEMKAYRKSKVQAEELRPYAKAYDLLSDLPRPVKPFKGKKLELNVMEAMYSEDIETLRAFDMVKPNLKLVLEAQILEKEPKDWSSAIEKAQARVATLRASLGAIRKVRERHQRLTTRLQDLDTRLKDEPALQLLMAAYADKASKKMAITIISKLLMEQVNKWASRFFPEHYTFDLQWEKTSLNILCTRKVGKAVRTSDVRALSGAESRIFTFITVMALLSFVPPKTRSSVLILDEPTTNMSAETASTFKELLEAMGRVIPCIVLMTPHEDETYINSTCYTVVKRKGTSTLVPGHPSTIKET